jgi:hypothetical protein
VLRKAFLAGPFFVLALAVLVIAMVVSQRDSSSAGGSNPDVAAFEVIREEVIVVGTLSPD